MKHNQPTVDNTEDVEKIKAQIEAELKEAAQAKINPNPQAIEEKEEEIVIPPPAYSLKVSSDKLIAYLRVKPSTETQEVTSEMVCSFLAENGINYGILENEIESFCLNRKFFLEIIAARGIGAIAESDGSLEFHFDTNANFGQPKEREDGTVDFHDLGLIQNVLKGQVLVTLIPPMGGLDGVDVYSGVVPYKHGKCPNLPAGANTVISDDGLQLLSAIDGCIENKGKTVSVNDAVTIKSDIDNSTGDIDAISSVIIFGDVREGFTVKSKKNIVIKGMVEGAFLFAGGDVTIANGMIGVGRGTIEAGGSVNGNYFQDCMIKCEGDVTADVIMNCDIVTQQSVILKGHKSALIGGKTSVRKFVYAKEIGTTSFKHTDITIEFEDFRSLFEIDDVELDKLKRGLKTKTDEISRIATQIDNVSDAMKQDIQNNNTRKMLKALMVQKQKLTFEFQDIRNAISKIEKPSLEANLFKVIAVGTAYPGVRITIGCHVLNLTDSYDNIKFYPDKYQIQTGMILPSDKI